MRRIAIGLVLTAAAISSLPAAAGAVPLSAQEFVPHRQRRERLVHGREPRRRPRSDGHVRPRLCDRLPRRRGAGGPDLRAASERAGPGAASGRTCATSRRRAALRLPRRWKASERSKSPTASSRAPTSPTASIRRARGRSSIRPKALPATTARSGSACAAWSPTRRCPGELSIATTGVGDAAALARVQAGALDASRALAEAYRRNNTGSYAEIGGILRLGQPGRRQPVGKAEGLANEALQKSNLGRYDEADALFGRVPPSWSAANPIVARQSAQLPRDAPAQPGRSPRPRWPSSTSRCRPARRIRTTASRRW